jgi:hypothetical protein
MFIANTTVRERQYVHTYCLSLTVVLGMNILSLPYSRIRYEHIVSDNMFIPNTTVRERQYVHT